MIFEDVLRDLVVYQNLVGTRVFVQHAPQVPASQMATPYMVLLNVGPSPLHAMGGPLDVIMREYQFSIFDTSQFTALALADSLRGALDGWHGDYEGIHFAAILYKAQTSAWEQSDELHHVVTSFDVIFRYLVTLPAGRQQPRQSKPQYQRKYHGIRTANP